jgi:hypothetical protein
MSCRGVNANAWRQGDGFWQYALFAAVAYIRAPPARSQLRAYHGPGAATCARFESAARRARGAGCDNRRMPERLEVQRAVAASAGEIFAVLTDPRGHVAIDSSGMLMQASGNIVAKVGDTFVVHMDREALNDYPLGLYDVTVEIVTFVPEQEIAWTVHGQLDLGHVYGYRLEPIEEGTLVTSYYDWSGAEQAWKDAAIFPVIPESALRATLGILARTVAPGKPRPASPAR